MNTNWDALFDDACINCGTPLQFDGTEATCRWCGWQYEGGISQMDATDVYDEVGTRVLEQAPMGAGSGY
tara:strand:+ start:133 stop:339 length:207 start_codon:yes stop_codon:yes gene_type:complete